MKYHIDQERNVILEAIKIHQGLATIVLSRDDYQFEMIVDSATAIPLQSHIGDYVKFSVEGWIEYRVNVIRE